MANAAAAGSGGKLDGGEQSSERERERERALRTEKTHATSSPQMKEKKRRKGEGRKEGSRCNPKKIGIAKSASSGVGG